MAHGIGIENDVVQELMDRTAIASVRAHYATITSGATFDGTSDWIDLGAVSPGSPSFEFGKETTDVFTGSPSSIKSRHITQWNGTIGFDIIDYNDNAINLSIGTTLAAESVADTVSPASTTVDDATVTPTRSLVPLATTVNIAAGDRLEFELGHAETFYENRTVLAVDALNSTVTLQGTLSQPPENGKAVVKISRVTNTIGGNKYRDYQMRVVASFDDGSFMVLHAPKGNFTASTTPNYEDGSAVVKIPLQFGIIATAEDYPGDPCFAKQVVLAKHHAFYGCN